MISIVYSIINFFLFQWLSDLLLLICYKNILKKQRHVHLYQFEFHYFRLRDYTRSESEKSFDECLIRRARLKSLGLAYLSPQNKSLAQSFRYMRTKPTIIAFKTPSLENCEYEVPSSTSKSSK